MEISKELKEAIVETMLKDRERYGGSDTAYAKTLNIHGTVFNRLKKGERASFVSFPMAKHRQKTASNTWQKYMESGRD
ncbi:hypothetical protein LEQ04_11605 [Riemerella anatipestifer]|nr:hypothetical protein LEQ04_11605 [Riemerella anatipestifer]